MQSLPMTCTSSSIAACEICSHSIPSLLCLPITSKLPHNLSTVLCPHATTGPSSMLNAPRSSSLFGIHTRGSPFLFGVCMCCYCYRRAAVFLASARPPEGTGCTAASATKVHGHHGPLRHEGERAALAFFVGVFLLLVTIFFCRRGGRRHVHTACPVLDVLSCCLWCCCKCTGHPRVGAKIRSVSLILIARRRRE